MAVASAGPYASLHLAPDRQPRQLPPLGRTMQQLFVAAVMRPYATISVAVMCTQVCQSELDLDTVKVILGEYRISNADVTLRHDATVEEIIDVIEGNRIYIPCIYVLNKIDQISIEVSCVTDSCLLYSVYSSSRISVEINGRIYLENSH